MITLTKEWIMKYFMMMTIVLFIFSGCSDDDTSSEQEETLAISEEDCQAKGAGWQWDEAEKVCKSKVSSPEANTSKNSTPENNTSKGTPENKMSLEKCESQGPDFYWDEKPNVLMVHGQEQPKKCKKALKCKVLKTEKERTTRSLRGAGYLPKLLPHSCMNIYPFDNITIINSTNRSMAINVYFQGEQCIRSIMTLVHDGTGVRDQKWSGVCDSLNAGWESCPSRTGVYEIYGGRTGFLIQKINKTKEELQKKGCYLKKMLLLEIYNNSGVKLLK